MTAEREEPSCPYCGETGGTPIEVYSHEYQGESPHGGIVEWCEEACTLCHGKPSVPQPVAVFATEQNESEEVPF
jgi:hypothetical protein